jgi:hypothetical protein
MEDRAKRYHKFSIFIFHFSLLTSRFYSGSGFSGLGLDDRAAFLTSVTDFPRLVRLDFFEIVSLFTL